MRHRCHKTTLFSVIRQVNLFNSGNDIYCRNHHNSTVIRNFLETELGYKDARSVEIQGVHRLNNKKDARPRAIIARFLRYKDCEQILSLGCRLKDTDYKMYQDLPYGICLKGGESKWTSSKPPKETRSQHHLVSRNRLNFT